MNLAKPGCDFSSAAERLKTACKSESAKVLMQVYDELIDYDYEHIARFAADDLGVTLPEALDDHRCKLWQNAVTMALHHHPDPEPYEDREEQPWRSSREVFAELLTHVAAGDGWPLEYDENTQFKMAHGALEKS